MSNLPPPNWLRTFEVAARVGGFTKAGEELGLTPAAVSQQIRSLELQLGFTLFDRQPRGVALNEIGRAYVQSVRRAFDELESATASLFWARDETAVTVRVPISYAALYLAPALKDFRRGHPKTSIRVCTALWAETLDDSTIDLDIRYGDGRWGEADVTQLTDPSSILVCPPGSPDPTRAADFLKAEAKRAIHVTGYEGLWAGMGRKFGLADIGPTGSLAADSSLVALEMVASGLGSAIIARDLARQHVSTGAVIAPSGFELAHGSAHFLVRPRRQVSPRPGALVFQNWLTEFHRRQDGSVHSTS